jgi:hypothetical protein
MKCGKQAARAMLSFVVGAAIALHYKQMINNQCFAIALSSNDRERAHSGPA